MAGIKVYRLPEAGVKYVIGADPAEGNPTSDDSALVVLAAQSGEHVAHLQGKIEPATFAAHIDAIGVWYNNAMVMVERANHGHAVLLWLRANSRLRRLRGHDRNEGWLSSGKGKILLYDALADALRNKEVIIRSYAIYRQIESIEGNTLRAPDGQPDDLADAFALAVAGAPQANRTMGQLERL